MSGLEAKTPQVAQLQWPYIYRCYSIMQINWKGKKNTFPISSPNTGGAKLLANRVGDCRLRMGNKESSTHSGVFKYPVRV